MGVGNGCIAEHCCETMRYNVEYTCNVHQDRFDCPDCLVDYNEPSGRYGLIILNDAGGGVIPSIIALGAAPNFPSRPTDRLMSAFDPLQTFTR